MAASEASCSSRNQGIEGLVSGNASRRTGQHDSHDLVSDASNMLPPPSCKSVTVCFGIGATDCKRNSPVPRKATSPSVMHSSWIQRLKPSIQSCNHKEEPSIFAKKEDVVCTHFTKDYSSCSRRLNKSPHHTRSSSWPPNGAQSEVVMQCPSEAKEPDHDIAQRHHNPAVNSPDCQHQSICVPLNKLNQRTGVGTRTDPFRQQQDCQKQVTTLEGFVPPAQPSDLDACTLSVGRTLGLQDCEDGVLRKPEICFGQQAYIGERDNADYIALFEQAKPHGRLQGTQNKWGNFDDSAHTLKNVFGAPRLPVSAHGAGCGNGASADADGSICFSKPFSFGVITSKEMYQTRLGDFDCKVKNSTAVVSSNKEKLNKFAFTVPSEKEAVQDEDGPALSLEDAGVPESPRIKQNFNLFKRSVVKASLLNDASSIGVLNNPSYRHSYSQKVCEGHTGDAMTAYGNRSSTVATAMLMPQNLASERRDLLPSKRFNVATSQNPQGLASRTFVSARSLHEEATRSHAREVSVGDNWNSWVNLLEEPNDDRLINTGHFRAGSQQEQQEFVMEDTYQQFSQQPTKEFGKFSGDRQLNYDSKDIGSCNLGKKGPSLKGQRKLSSFGIDSMQLNQLPDQVPNSGMDFSEFSQEQYLHLYEGSSNRFVSHPRTINAGFHRRIPDYGSSQSRMHSIYLSPELVNNDTGKKEQNMHGRWLQRWQSTDRGSSMAEKPSAFFGYNSRSLSSDRLVKLPKNCSASEHSIKGSSHKDMNPLEVSLRESVRGVDRYIESSAAPGSASTPGFRTAGRNFSSFRSGYMGPSIEAMAIAGKSACKLHPGSSWNGGFYHLSSRHTTSNCVIFSEGVKDADEDKMHLVDLSKDLQGDFGGV